MTTGSWKGAGTAALHGAADGYMGGAIGGAVTGAAGNALKVGKAAQMWDKGTFKSGYRSMKHHYNNHVVKQGFSKGNNIVKYTKDATSFMNRNARNLKFSYSEKYKMIRWAGSDSKGGGLFSKSGKIITYWYKGGK